MSIWQLPQAAGHSVNVCEATYGAKNKYPALWNGLAKKKQGYAP